MKIIAINKNVLDVFMDFNTSPTGFEPSCWVRLHKPKDLGWKQVAGIRLPSKHFQMLLQELKETSNVPENVETASCACNINAGAWDCGHFMPDGSYFG